MGSSTSIIQYCPESQKLGMGKKKSEALVKGKIWILIQTQLSIIRAVGLALWGRRRILIRISCEDEVII